MTDTMSKALEAAQAAAKRELQARPMLSAGQDQVDTIHAGKIADAVITEYLAHLAEDEAVVEKLAATIYPIPNSDVTDARNIAKAVLKTLAGKE